MRATSITPVRSLVSGLLLVGTLAAGAAQAQVLDCRTPEPPSIGAVVGRSSSYLYLAEAAVPTAQWESVLVGGGPLVGVRGDLPIAGPSRLRLEAAAARWDVVRQTYDPAAGYAITATKSAGHIDVRQIGAAIGLRGGRYPACAHVLAGGGVYSMTFRDVTVRRPGAELAAGIEIPTGERGRVQVDVQLHIIDTNGRYPLSSTTALAAALMAGWTFRF